MLSQSKLDKYLICCPQIQGLLRQLVLVPNVDTTNQMCPSSDPQLAALSVPPLLVDLPVGAQQDDRRTTSSGNLQSLHMECDGCQQEFRSLIALLHQCDLSESMQQVSVGLESSCSELLQGQLWFDPLKRGLYLCNGSSWITVLEGNN